MRLQGWPHKGRPSTLFTKERQRDEPTLSKSPIKGRPEFYKLNPPRAYKASGTITILIGYRVFRDSLSRMVALGLYSYVF
jgi:hypothetical protein